MVAPLTVLIQLSCPDCPMGVRIKSRWEDPGPLHRCGGQLVHFTIRERTDGHYLGRTDEGWLDPNDRREIRQGFTRSVLYF